MTTRTLPKTVTKAKKRVGRGYGSGKGGHTVGRGQKGQKTRSRMSVIFEGVKMKKSQIKRLPLRRGKGKFKAKNKPLIVNISLLNLLPNSSNVDIDLLTKSGIVDAKQAAHFGVKILGDGEIKKKLTINLPISKSATRKIEKVGGKVVKEKSNIISKKSKLK